MNAINSANANGQENTILLEIGFYTITTPFDPGPHTAVGLPPITSVLTIQGASGILTVIRPESRLAPRVGV
jgi:hypothetical protein